MLKMIKELSKQDPVDCPNKCGRRYSGTYRKTVLTNHLRYECGKEPTFQCDICFKKFYFKGNRKTHMITVHKMLPKEKETILYT